MSRKSAEKKHDLTADEHQKRLVALMREFSYAHNLYTVFSDFVEVCAISISNAVDQSNFEAREKRYLEIVGKYKREEIERFTQMFGELVLSFEKRCAVVRKASPDAELPYGGGMTDALGQIYMMLELGNERAGQFFTPYSVSQMMAAMLFGDGGDEVRKHGFVRLQEPACGAGGMVIASADALLSAGTNYQQAMHATCVDIDPCCVQMAYVQLSLLHIPAIVVHGNALSMEVWGLWYTPAHIVGGWNWKLKHRDVMQALANRTTLEHETLDEPNPMPEQVADEPVASDGDVVPLTDEVLVAEGASVAVAAKAAMTPALESVSIMDPVDEVFETAAPAVHHLRECRATLALCLGTDSAKNACLRNSSERRRARG